MLQGITFYQCDKKLRTPWIPNVKPFLIVPDNGQKFGKMIECQRASFFLQSAPI